MTDKNRTIPNNSILMKHMSRGNIAISLLIARTKSDFGGLTSSIECRNQIYLAKYVVSLLITAQSIEN